MIQAYRPGACNIGPLEIERRRRSAIAITLLAIFVAGVLLVGDLPVVARLGIFPFAAAAAVNWLQVVRRFCVGFAALGVRNFGGRGELEAVEDAEARSADRRKALLMVLEGSIYGGLATLGLVLIGG